MKVMAFSDLHHSRARAADLVEVSVAADLVIGAGDFCNGRRGLADAMALLADISCPMVLVPGNAESADELRGVAGKGVTVLHGEATQVDGLRLFGLGYAVPVTPFGDWSCDLTEDEAGQMLAQCETADILISHSPPKGVVDRSSSGRSIGSTAVLAAIERIQPKLVFCGHVHDSWGQSALVGESHVHNLGPTPNWFEV